MLTPKLTAGFQQLVVPYSYVKKQAAGSYREQNRADHQEIRKPKPAMVCPVDVVIVVVARLVSLRSRPLGLDTLIRPINPAG